MLRFPFASLPPIHSPNFSTLHSPQEAHSCGPRHPGALTLWPTGTCQWKAPADQGEKTTSSLNHPVAVQPMSSHYTWGYLLPAQPILFAPSSIWATGPPPCPSNVLHLPCRNPILLPTLWKWSLIKLSSNPSIWQCHLSAPDWLQI